MLTAEQKAIRAVKGAPGYYVSSDGLVFSTCRHGRHLVPDGPLKSLRQTVSKRGRYMVVDIKVNGVRKKRYVHQLVLEAFVRDRTPGEETRHLDGNRANNDVTNLTWGTDVENGADRVVHGTARRGSNAHGARLNEDRVRRILIDLAAGVSRRDLSEENAVSLATIDLIASRKRWKHVEAPC